MNQFDNTEAPKKDILDLPKGWGPTQEEFKAQVIATIQYLPLWANGPVYDIPNDDGSTTPFYPVLCAVLPKWGVITRQEIEELLKARFLERVRGAYDSATRSYADHMGWEEYLAWGLENKIFSQKEIKEIHFDHGDTVDSYIRAYRKSNLLEETLREASEKLIYPRSPIQTIQNKTIGDVDDCFCCC